MKSQDNDFDAMANIVDPFIDDLESLAAIDTNAPKEPRHGLNRDQILRRRVLCALGAVMYEGVMLGIMGVRGDLATLGIGTLVGGAGLPLLASALALLIATRTGPLRVGQAESVVGALLLGPLAVFCLSSLASMEGGSPPSFWVATAMCMIGTIMFAAGPLLLAILAFRRSFVAASHSKTAALGVACGALATGVFDLRCAVGSVPHVLLGHGAALVVGGLVGYQLARFTRA